MIYIFSIFILCAGYYTMTYGVYLWKKEENKLGGFGAVMLSIIGTIVPLVVLFLKR